MIVAFAFTETPSRMQLIIYETLIFFVMIIKVVLLIQKHFFYDPIMASIKFNSATFFLSFYFAQVITILMDLDKQTGFVFVLILSCITIMSLSNLSIYW